jgi:hypothetical protein
MVGLSSGLLAATSLFSITAIIQLFRTDRKVHSIRIKNFVQISFSIMIQKKKRVSHFYHNNNNSEKLTGGFFGFYFVMYFIQHCFICRPSDFTVSEDARIEHRTVATLALAVRRFNLSARSHPEFRKVFHANRCCVFVTLQILCLIGTFMTYLKQGISSKNRSI